jgi:hypothetical protein
MLLTQLIFVIKMYVLNINWATGMYINFVNVNTQYYKMQIITGS